LTTGVCRVIMCIIIIIILSLSPRTPLEDVYTIQTRIRRLTPKRRRRRIDCATGDGTNEPFGFMLIFYNIIFFYNRKASLDWRRRPAACHRDDHLLLRRTTSKTMMILLCADNRYYVVIVRRWICNTHYRVQHYTWLWALAFSRCLFRGQTPVALDCHYTSKPTSS